MGIYNVITAAWLWNKFMTSCRVPCARQQFVATMHFSIQMSKPSFFFEIITSRAARSPLWMAPSIYPSHLTAHVWCRSAAQRSRSVKVRVRVNPRGNGCGARMHGVSRLCAGNGGLQYARHQLHSAPPSKTVNDKPAKTAQNVNRTVINLDFVGVARKVGMVYGSRAGLIGFAGKMQYSDYRLTATQLALASARTPALWVIHPFT